MNIIACRLLISDYRLKKDKPMEGALFINQKRTTLRMPVSLILRLFLNEPVYQRDILQRKIFFNDIRDKDRE